MIQSLAECWYVQCSKLSCFSLNLFKLYFLLQCFFISSFLQLIVITFTKADHHGKQGKSYMRQAFSYLLRPVVINLVSKTYSKYTDQ